MKTALGFLAGVAVGVSAGLLFAPQSGAETQDYISQKARTGLDQVSAAGAKLRTQAGDWVSKAKDQVSDAAEAGAQTYRDHTGA